MKRLNTLIVAAVLGSFGIAVGPDVASLIQRGGDTHLVAQDADVPEQEAPAPPVEDIPDGAVSIPPAPDSGVEPAPTVPPESSEVLMPEPPGLPPVVSEFVHRISVRCGNEAWHGSATHVGNGVFLTCKHVCNRPQFQLEIDGVQYPAHVTWSPTSDFAVVRTEGFEGPAAKVSVEELKDGAYLRVCGTKTGMHYGDLTDVRYRDGYRTVDSKTSTVSGDSGAGVFDVYGRLVGVHWGSDASTSIFFTPLSHVAALVAPFSPDAAVSPAAAPGADTTLRQAIAAYRASGGGVAYVEGKSDAQHLVDEHGWSADQIRGLSRQEMQYLHGASHAGRLHPSSFRTVSVAVPESGRPVVTVYSPASFHCPQCNRIKGFDWSNEPYDVRFVTRDGFNRYPMIQWQGSNGKTQQKAGAYRPRQIRWMVERTTGDCRCGGDPESPDCECRKAGRECRCGTTSRRLRQI